MLQTFFYYKAEGIIVLEIKSSCQYMYLFTPFFLGGGVFSIHKNNIEYIF